MRNLRDKRGFEIKMKGDRCENCPAISLEGSTRNTPELTVKETRHARTSTYGYKPIAEQQRYLNLHPDDAVVDDIESLIKILKQDGVFDNAAKNSLINMAKQTQLSFPNVFNSNNILSKINWDIN